MSSMVAVRAQSNVAKWQRNIIVDDNTWCQTTSIWYLHVLLRDCFLFQGFGDGQSAPVHECLGFQEVHFAEFELLFYEVMLRCHRMKTYHQTDHHIWGQYTLLLSAGRYDQCTESLYYGAYLYNLLQGFRDPQ